MLPAGHKQKKLICIATSRKQEQEGNEDGLLHFASFVPPCPASRVCQVTMKRSMVRRDEVVSPIQTQCTLVLSFA